MAALASLRLLALQHDRASGRSPAALPAVGRRGREGRARPWTDRAAAPRGLGQVAERHRHV